MGRVTARQWFTCWEETAGTPLDTPNDKRLLQFHNSFEFERGGNGDFLEDCQDNHFELVFVLTSTREASKSLTLFPELTEVGIALKLSFTDALPEAVEIFLSGERFSQNSIEISRNISKNSPLVNG